MHKKMQLDSVFESRCKGRMYFYDVQEKNINPNPRGG